MREFGRVAFRLLINYHLTKREAEALPSVPSAGTSQWEAMGVIIKPLKTPSLSSLITRKLSDGGVFGRSVIRTFLCYLTSNLAERVNLLLRADQGATQCTSH